MHYIFQVSQQLPRCNSINQLQYGVQELKDLGVDLSDRIEVKKIDFDMVRAVPALLPVCFLPLRSRIVTDERPSHTSRSTCRAPTT